ncbi:MAG: DNA recombination protein RmuC [Pseudomonadota bacterium]
MIALPALDLADPLHQIAAVAAAMCLVLFLLLALSAQRAGRAARQTRALAAQVERLSQTQAELSGAQNHATQRLDRRFDTLSADMGASLATSADRTAHSLGALQERLEAIDRAQANIEKLSGDVLCLQDILSNKQTRGAFGEIQLHDLLRGALPPDAWRWQVVLPNGTRADCVIDLPDPPGRIVIDAKFPLEGYEALRAAATPAEARVAARAFRTSIRAHIKAISEKYLLPGHTADSALMFLPSEAVYAELHANFADLVREGFHARVWTVSPTTCMALLNTLRAVLKDTRLRQEARAIRATLRLLHRDIELVGDRVTKLRGHFALAQTDLDGIEAAASRARGRADRLESLEFDDQPDPGGKRDVRILRS